MDASRFALRGGLRKDGVVVPSSRSQIAEKGVKGRLLRTEIEGLLMPVNCPAAIGEFKHGYCGVVSLKALMRGRGEQTSGSTARVMNVSLMARGFVRQTEFEEGKGRYRRKGALEATREGQSTDLRVSGPLLKPRLSLIDSDSEDSYKRYPTTIYGVS